MTTKLRTPFQASHGGTVNWYYRVSPPKSGDPGSMAGMVGPFKSEGEARIDIHLADVRAYADRQELAVTDDDLVEMARRLMDGEDMPAIKSRLRYRSMERRADDWEV